MGVTVNKHHGIEVEIRGIRKSAHIVATVPPATRLTRASGKPLPGTCVTGFPSADAVLALGTGKVAQKWHREDLFQSEFRRD
jgi:hypothetical protein